jgi:hypothetical protein
MKTCIVSSASEALELTLEMLSERRIVASSVCVCVWLWKVRVEYRRGEDVQVDDDGVARKLTSIAGRDSGDKRWLRVEGSGRGGSREGCRVSE